MAIRIFVTVGTFDKEDDEIHGRLFFKDAHVAEMLKLGRSRVDVSVRTLMMIDSLEMTDADREVIVTNCRSCDEGRIVITHGTDTKCAGRARRVPRADTRSRSRVGVDLAKPLITNRLRDSWWLVRSSL